LGRKQEDTSSFNYYIISKETNAASNLFKPQLSNFLATGNKMNEINNAMLSPHATLPFWY
jgi:hypothetical protein